ncbi:MAG: N-acylglucosamine 2-epimerase, partial [uncultured bacterium]
MLASGLPYLLGTERNKGSHSMSGYHSFELCYLAAVYTNLLITKQPLDLYFKPMQGGFKDNILRVAPDLLPEGSIRIESVTVDGAPYTDFDADKLTVRIPATGDRPKIRVRIVPAEGMAHFTATVAITQDTATVTLTGDLDSRALPFFRSELDK